MSGIWKLGLILHGSIVDYGVFEFHTFSSRSGELLPEVVCTCHLFVGCLCRWGCVQVWRVWKRNVRIDWCGTLHNA